MTPIISPIDRNLLLDELSHLTCLRPTHKADNLIYDFTAHTCPHLMREVARLRELSFRTAGGSVGNAFDMDDMDTMTSPYHQLIVWDPSHNEIVGGYRYLCCSEASFTSDGQPYITSAHLFHYTDYFIHDYLPYTIEFGRAFVQPMYQDRAMGVKSLYALDNIWDGIGAVLYQHPHVKYLIGKVTIYPSYDNLARNLIYAYLRRYHFDHKGLYSPKIPVDISTDGQELADDLFIGNDPQLNYQILQRAIRARGTTLPPMFSAYLNVSNSLLAFGNAVNDEMSDVYETGILVEVDQINPDKHERYIGAYIEYLKSLMESHHKSNK